MNTTPRPDGPNQRPNPNQQQGRPPFPGGPQQRPPYGAAPQQGPVYGPRPRPPYGRAAQQPPYLLQPQYPNGAHFQAMGGPRPAYPYATVKPSEPWWEKDGVVAKLFAGAGVLVTLIGVVMLLVIAARAGLLRPELRVGGGALLSAALLAGSTRLHQRLGGRIGAIALAATGTAGLFLCVLAATNFYGWIPAVAGLTLAAVVAAGTVALATKWNSQVLAVLMTAAVGVLAPVLTHGVSTTLVAFLVLLQAAGCIPEFTRQWPGIAVARTLPVAIATGIVVVDDKFALASQLAAYLVATIGLASALPASRRTTEWVTALTYGAASAPMIVAIQALDFRVAAIAGTAIAAITLTSIVIARPVGLATTAVATLVTGAAMLSAATVITTGAWLAPILLAIALVLAVSVYQVKNHFVAALSLAFTLLGIGQTTNPGMALWPENYAAQSLTTGLLLAAIVAVGLLVGIRRYGADPIGAIFLAAFGLLMATYFLAGGAAALAFGSDAAQVGHVGTTVSWMLLAAGVLAVSLKVEKPGLLLGLGLGLAGLSLGRLFLSDLANTGGVVRAAAFIITGLVLLGAGAGYARAFAQQKATREPADGPTGTPADADSHVGARRG